LKRAAGAEKKVIKKRKIVATLPKKMVVATPKKMLATTTKTLLKAITTTTSPMPKGPRLGNWVQKQRQ